MPDVEEDRVFDFIRLGERRSIDDLEEDHHSVETCLADTENPGRRNAQGLGLESDEVIPDRIVGAKGVVVWFPSAGVIVNDTIASELLGRFSNFSSHQSDPVAASAISAVIDVIRSEDLLSNVKNIGSSEDFKSGEKDKNLSSLNFRIVRLSARSTTK